MKKLLFVRPEDVIPDPGRNPKALVVGLEVVRHVVPAQLHEIFALEAEVVQGIVGHVVDHIPKHKTSKDPIDIIRQFEQGPNQTQKQPIEDRRERYADHWRHHQPGFLPRLGMMHAVHQEQHTLHSFGRILRRKVKDKPM